VGRTPPDVAAAREEAPVGRVSEYSEEARDLRRLVFRGRIVVVRAVDQVLAAREIRPVEDHTDTGQEVSGEPTTATLSA
jgi:hypothetical protein